MPENLYRRKGVWYARVKTNGREYRPSLRTRSKVEARQKLRKILGEIDHVRITGEDRHSWKAAVVEWAGAMVNAVKPSVLERYALSLKQCSDCLDGLYVDEVTTKVIAKIVRERRAAGATNATIQRDLTAVSSVLTYCCAQGWREDNPAKAYDRSVIKVKREPIVLPDLADIDATVAAAKGNFANMIRFAQYTGMRQEEIASLERKHIRDGVADLSKTKTSRPRAVPLDERAKGTLKGTVPALMAPWVFWHEDEEEIRRYCSVSANFAQLHRRLFKQQKIGRRFRFHDLRHWYAVDYLRGGGNIYDLQMILGHSSIKTTELYLDFLTPEEKKIAKHGAQSGHK